MVNVQNILKAVIRIGIGLLFIVSAVLKLLSLDQFELYIYSFNILNFTWSMLAARAIIACEILLGILLIIKIKYKPAWWLTLLMLIGFSLLLIYVILFRNDSNCHCMGDLVEIKPSWSLVKNLVAIALLFCVRKEEDYNYKFWGKTLGLVGAFIAALVPPFVLFPTDNVYNLFSKSDNLDYNETAFNALMADSTMQDVRLDDGRYVVGVISAGCEFCRISCLKVSEMVDNNRLDTSRILFFVWGGDSATVRQFQTETKTEAYRYVPIRALDAVHVVNGQFPTYLFIQNGDVESTADLRQLTEKKLSDHLH
ncbi:MAG: DoxX family membrane protein [Bacteroidales bacterium]|nr:DoxX family membrane protein [Bacteroidales bacterium]